MSLVPSDSQLETMRGWVLVGFRVPGAVAAGLAPGVQGALILVTGRHSFHDKPGNDRWGNRGSGPSTGHLQH